MRAHCQHASFDQRAAALAGVPGRIEPAALLLRVLERARVLQYGALDVAALLEQRGQADARDVVVRPQLHRPR